MSKKYVSFQNLKCNFYFFSLKRFKSVILYNSSDYSIYLIDFDLIFVVVINSEVKYAGFSC